MKQRNEDTRIWCEYCRVFVYNNRINREKHDNSPQHQANFKKKVEHLRREEEARKRLHLDDKEPSSAATKSLSFYNTAPKISGITATKPVNILNLKSSFNKGSEKKAVLGLSSSTIIVKQSNSGTMEHLEVTKFKDAQKSTDIKTFASEMKRKIKDDELSLLDGNTDKELVVGIVDEDDALKMLSLMKSKKSKRLQ